MRLNIVFWEEVRRFRQAVRGVHVTKSLRTSDLKCGVSLTLSSRVVSTARYNAETPYLAHTICLCVAYDAYSKWPLSPYIAFTGWFFSSGSSVLCQVRTEYMYIVYSNFGLHWVVCSFSIVSTLYFKHASVWEMFKEAEEKFVYDDALQSVYNGSESHPAPCLMATGDSFSAVKAAGSWNWLFTPTDAEVEKKWSYTSPSPCVAMGCRGTDLPCL
jgi:hypothetical protein